MNTSLKKLFDGYADFKQKYADQRNNVMKDLATHGQHPETMVVACSDSRVDPALITQCDPGDLFTIRNVANLIPPYNLQENYSSTGAALEYGINFLQVKNLIILGHSQCGGIQGLKDPETIQSTDFITNWVQTTHITAEKSCDQCSQQSLLQSYQHCLGFPWIQQRIDDGRLKIHLWFFDIASATLSSYCETNKKFMAIEHQ